MEFAVSREYDAAFLIWYKEKRSVICVQSFHEISTGFIKISRGFSFVEYSSGDFWSPKGYFVRCFSSSNKKIFLWNDFSFSSLSNI